MQTSLSRPAYRVVILLERFSGTHPTSALYDAFSNYEAGWSAQAFADLLLELSIAGLIKQIRPGFYTRIDDEV